jgi:hypothetical protein
MVYNQEIAEILVIGGAIVIAVGLFWRIFVIGLVGIFCLFVFINHNKVETTVPNIENQFSSVAPEIRNNKPIEERPNVFIAECLKFGFTKENCSDILNDKIPEDKQLDEHQAYLIDCMKLTNYEYETCDQMWTNRQNGDLQNARYRKGKNQMMKVGNKT